MKKTIALFVAILSVLTASAVDREISLPVEGDTLAGTLSLPEGASPRAVLVLATGSGTQDRDETVYGLKPFKTIADFLVDNGYAVLRFDDRGAGSSTSHVKDATTSTFVGDISAAVNLAGSLVPSTPVGVLGHSEGGTIAVRVARSNPLCRFIITLAAPAWRGDSIVMSQARIATKALGTEWKGENVQRRLLQLAASPVQDRLAKPLMIQAVVEGNPQVLDIPANKQMIESNIDAMLTPWYREFLRYDPAPDIAAVTVPWMAFNGDKDTQVPVANLIDIKKLNPSAEITVMLGHNHLMQKAGTGMFDEYSRAGDAPTADLLALMAEWLDSLAF